jgi:hypothetical protein
MSEVVCSQCGTRFTEDNDNDELATEEFAQAMEWYFNRDESDEWTEYLEWKASKDSASS